jgi:hypothetical protein
MSDSQKSDIMALRSTDPVFRGQAKRTQEMPVHPGLEGKLKWKQSTVPLASEMRSNLTRISSGSKLNSTKKNGLLKNYVSVEKREQLKRTQIRGLKAQGADVTKFIQTGKLQDDPLMPTYNRLSKEPSTKYRLYSHTGSWSYNAKEGRMMWSDTGSFIFDSPGDHVKVVNPGGYNFASPTVSRGENLGYTVFEIKSTSGV